MTDTKKLKAYVTSIGERTTKLCIEQLIKYGFDVVVLDEDEKWIDKYKRFIKLADEDCLRIDADTLVNENAMLIGIDIKSDEYYIAHSYYDIYKNNISLGGPVFYTRRALKIIRENIDLISEQRPETSAVRLKQFIGHQGRRAMVIGIHGLGQDEEAIQRAIQNKEMRGQMKEYDFEFIDKINKLYD